MVRALQSTPHIENQTKKLIFQIENLEMTDKSNKKVDMSRWHEWHVNSYWCRGTCTPPSHRHPPTPSPPVAIAADPPTMSPALFPPIATAPGLANGSSPSRRRTFPGPDLHRVPAAGTGLVEGSPSMAPALPGEVRAGSSSFRRGRRRPRDRRDGWDGPLPSAWDRSTDVRPALRWTGITWDACCCPRCCLAVAAA